MHKELDSTEDLFDYKSMLSLVYLRNLIDETLRYTYFIYAMSRLNDGPDIELPGGYVIESGVGINVCNKPIFYHPDYWHEPNVFNPDRFLNPKSRGLHFQPFGYQGGRVCPGSNLANVETLFTVASIFKRFRVELDQNQKDI